MIVPDGAADRFALSAPASLRPTANAAESEGERAETHRVRSGESLSVIAARHGVSVSALQRANGMGRRTTLRVGQLLRLPA